MTSLEILDLSSEEDVRFVYEARRHPEVAANLIGPPPPSLEAHKAWLAENMHVTRVVYVLKDEGVPVGYCQAVLSGKDWVELGFVVYPTFQGKGYGGSMVRMLVKRVEEDMPGRKVFLEVKASNGRAEKLYEMGGFTRTRVRMERG